MNRVVYLANKGPGYSLRNFCSRQNPRFYKVVRCRRSSNEPPRTYFLLCLT
jgi:hypothetical protein